MSFGIWKNFSLEKSSGADPSCYVTTSREVGAAPCEHECFCVEMFEYSPSSGIDGYLAIPVRL